MTEKTQQLREGTLARSELKRAHLDRKSHVRTYTLSPRHYQEAVDYIMMPPHTREVENSRP